MSQLAAISRIRTWRNTDFWWISQFPESSWEFQNYMKKFQDCPWGLFDFPRCLGLGEVDPWGCTAVCRRTVLCVVECLVTAPASSPWTPVACTPSQPQPLPDVSVLTLGHNTIPFLLCKVLHLSFYFSINICNYLSLSVWVNLSQLSF